LTAVNVFVAPDAAAARFEAAYTLRWLDEILGADDERTCRFRDLLEPSGS
jgi:hypothetical protein